MAYNLATLTAVIRDCQQRHGDLPPEQFARVTAGCIADWLMGPGGSVVSDEVGMGCLGFADNILRWILRDVKGEGNAATLRNVLRSFGTLPKMPPVEPNPTAFLASALEAERRLREGEGPPSFASDEATEEEPPGVIVYSPPLRKGAEPEDDKDNTRDLR